ncbi:HAMP domain-containing protein [Rhodovarius crocodyli]|uniref:histidine kinase n=1 Tax=Rhodovarius crocodyli TaxID=1979269 RepID=A0A437MNW5_9PROT|nr:ATP-binding protein [Rhodovarius crocodyli]RVT99337.1 HAMP domain-containing protein [Rhodovarius crocodyli]
MSDAALPAAPVSARRDCPLRRLLPKGLLGRAVLIILVPLLVVQTVALTAFYGGHLDVISRRLSSSLAGEIGMVAQLLNRTPEEAHPVILREATWRLGMSAAFEPGARLGAVPQRPAWNSLLPLEEDLHDALSRLVALPFDADWQSDPQNIVVRVQLPGGVLYVEAPRKRLFSATLYWFMIWLVGSAVVFAVIAVLFMRIQVRAIRRLAMAADSFGQGRDIGPIKPEGAAEVRQAAIAFNSMRDNVRRFVAQRTDMLAGISHDLRTPLTRMRLTLAMLPPTPELREDVDGLVHDTEEMERLVEAYLAFARGESLEKPVETDLVPMLRDLAESARRSGGQLSTELPEALRLPLREGAVRRAVGNLLDNARRHASIVRLSAQADEHWAEILVDDDGPGIPEAERERAFKPFASGSATGTGLGLAIARDVVRGHGGDILLEASPMGGLRARVRLPI